MKKNTLKILLLTAASIILIVSSIVFIIDGRSPNDTIELVYVDDINFQSEGGDLSGTYVGGKLLSIEIRLFRSMFQTNEKYFISSDTIFYEKLTYIYDEPMNTSSMVINEEYYVILNGDVYVKKYDEDKNQDVLIKDRENTDIIEKYLEYKRIIEEKYEEGFALQPGGLSNESFRLNEASIYNAVRKDTWAYGNDFAMSDAYEISPTGMYKVYLVISTSDYHWYRQNPDGKTWSHKRGERAVTNREDFAEDGHNAIITDPEKAYKGDYNNVGYYVTGKAV